MIKLLVGYVAATLLPFLIVLFHFTAGKAVSLGTSILLYNFLLPELGFFRDAITFHPIQIVTKLCFSFCFGSFILYVMPEGLKNKIKNLDREKVVDHIHKISFWIALLLSISFVVHTGTLYVLLCFTYRTLLPPDEFIWIASRPSYGMLLIGGWMPITLPASFLLTLFFYSYTKVFKKDD